MIPDIIIGVVVGILRGVISLIPEWELPSEVTGGGWVGELVTWLAYGNTFFPIIHLGIALSIILSVRLAILIWLGLVWVYRHIPFKAT